MPTWVWRFCHAHPSTSATFAAVSRPPLRYAGGHDERYLAQMRAVIVGLTLLVLSACGANEPKLKPETVDMLNEFADSMENMPKCSNVWIVGKRLPKDYDGCKDGGLLSVVIGQCDGVTVYENETTELGYWTKPDRSIHGGVKDYANDPEYGKVLEANC